MSTAQQATPVCTAFKVKLKADESANTALLAGINKLREESRYTDVVFELDDNSTIAAHRVVLAAFCEYFERLLGPNMQEGQKYEPIRLRNVHRESMMAIVNYAYNCEIEITMDNVYSLLETADYLMIRPIIEGCCNFLESAMNSDNCFTILSLADQYDIMELDYAVAKYITEHFEDVRSQPEFLKMPATTFLTILQKDSIVVTKSKLVVPSEDQEYTILKAVFDYVVHNGSLPTKDVLELLKLVKVGVISREHMEEIKENYKTYLTEHTEVSQLVFRKTIGKKQCTPRSYPKLCRFWLSRALGTGGGPNVSQVVKRFDHSKDKSIGKDDYISGMELSFNMLDLSLVLAGFTVYYSNDYKETYGNLELPDKFSFRLKPGERIVKIETNCEKMINSLTFVTNMGTILGPYGGSDGKHRVIQPAPNSYPFLARVSGCVTIPCEAESSEKEKLGIARMKFYFQAYQLSSEGTDPTSEIYDYDIFGVYGESDSDRDTELCSLESENNYWEDLDDDDDYDYSDDDFQVPEDEDPLSFIRGRNPYLLGPIVPYAFDPPAKATD